MSMAIPWCSNKKNWLLLFRLLVRFLHAADSASLIGHFAPTLDSGTVEVTMYKYN